MPSCEAAQCIAEAIFRNQYSNFCNDDVWQIGSDKHRMGRPNRDRINIPSGVVKTLNSGRLVANPAVTACGNNIPDGLCYLIVSIFRLAARVNVPNQGRSCLRYSRNILIFRLTSAATHSPSPSALLCAVDRIATSDFLISSR